MGRGFEINERGMREMERALQERFAAMDIRVPIKADAPDLGSGNVFIVTGDQAQVVMGDNTGTLAQGDVVQVAPDYAELALAVHKVADLLRGFDEISPEDLEVLEDSSAEALAELAKPRPDRRFLSRVLAALRGVATPALAALGTAAGSGVGAQLAALVGQLQLPALPT